MRAKKEEILVNAKANILSNESCIVFFHYHTLTVQIFENLRKNIRKIDGSGVKVIKNTLSKLLFEDVTSLREDLNAKCKGPMALAYSTRDPIALANEMNSFFNANKKKFPKVELQYCLLSNQLHTGELVNTLSEYKTINNLKASFVGLLQQPAQSLIGILNAPASHYIGVLEAKANKE